MKVKSFCLSTEEFVRRSVDCVPSTLKESIERVYDLLEDDTDRQQFQYEVRDGASCLEETPFIVK